MISIISPAKSMDFISPAFNDKTTTLSFSENSAITLKELQSLSISQIKTTLNVSDKIAKINYDRYQTYDQLPEKQAFFAYMGDVYKNINIASMSNEMIIFAQHHLRILSALYGYLKPLDKIKAYRLEMSSKLPNLPEKNMAGFWREYITNSIKKELTTHKNKTLINLASNEYFSSINEKTLESEVINIHFREIRNGVIRNIALNSKRARGMMVDYIIRNNIDYHEDIKSFEKSGYIFNKDMSDKNNFFFVKKESI